MKRPKVTYETMFLSFDGRKIEIHYHPYWAYVIWTQSMKYYNVFLRRLYGTKSFR